MAQLRCARSGFAARARRARRLLDADAYQLAAPGAVRARGVAGLPSRRVDRARRPHTGVLVRARHRGCPAAAAERAIDYPVALDNHYAVWTAFDNHYWPALYFVDAKGNIRHQHFGKGRYGKSERTIQRLLDVERPLVSVEGAGVEAAADWDRLRSPETYLGYARAARLASPHGAEFDHRRAYEEPARLALNEWALDGEWTIGREKVVAEQGGGSIAFRFHARDVNLVLSARARDYIPFRVLLEGDDPGPSSGVDVDDDGNGLLRDGRLYQLVRQYGLLRHRTLTITFLAAGAEA